MKRYMFSATVSVEADSVEEARQLIDREFNEAKAPIGRRIRGEVTKINVELGPEPIKPT